MLPSFSAAASVSEFVLHMLAQLLKSSPIITITREYSLNFVGDLKAGFFAKFLRRGGSRKLLIGTSGELHPQPCMVCRNILP